MKSRSHGEVPEFSFCLLWSPGVVMLQWPGVEKGCLAIRRGICKVPIRSLARAWAEEMRDGTSHIAYYSSWPKISFLSGGIPSPACSHLATLLKKYQFIPLRNTITGSSEHRCFLSFQGRKAMTHVFSLGNLLLGISYWNGKAVGESANT